MGSLLEINKASAIHLGKGGIGVNMSKPHPLDDESTKILSTRKSVVVPHAGPSVRFGLL